MGARLTFRECLVFPVSTPEARRDLVVGGLWLFTLVFGWILNLGHRLDVVRRIYHDDEPYFRGFSPHGQTFRRGLLATVAIAVYLLPAMVLATLAWLAWSSPVASVLGVLSLVCFLAGIFALPGGMTCNAAFDDLSFLYRPDQALAGPRGRTGLSQGVGHRLRRHRAVLSGAGRARRRVLLQQRLGLAGHGICLLAGSRAGRLGDNHHQTGVTGYP